MATPTVEDARTQRFSSADTDHLVAMDTTTVSGELLIIAIATDDTNNQTEPTDWSTWDHQSIAGAGKLGFYYKVADGTEGGTTVNVVTSSAKTGAAIVYRISGWGGTVSTDVDIATAVAETTSSPNPPSVTADWGADTNLFITFVWAANDNETASSGPSSWTNLLTIEAQGGSNDGPSVHSARLASSNATGDPGTFSLSGSETCESNTIVIKPAAAGGVNPKGPLGMPLHGPLGGPV
jgi:hypothetical protein